MADCKYELNGIALSDEEVFDLQMDAIRDLDSERSIIVSQSMLSSKALIQKLQQNGVVNLKPWKGNYRIPIGRFKSDLIQQKAVKKVKKLTHTIQVNYGNEADVLVL